MTSAGIGISPALNRSGINAASDPNVKTTVNEALTSVDFTLRRTDTSANSGEVLSSPASPTDESPNSEEESQQSPPDLWSFETKLRSKGAINSHPFMIPSDANLSADQPGGIERSDPTAGSLAQKFLVAFDTESPFGPSNKVGSPRNPYGGPPSTYPLGGTRIFQMDVPADLSSAMRPKIVLGETKDSDVSGRQRHSENKVGQTKEANSEAVVKSEVPMDEGTAEDDSPGSAQSFNVATEETSADGNAVKTGSKRKISSNSGGSRKGNVVALKTAASLQEDSSGVTTRRRSTNSQVQQLAADLNGVATNLSTEYRHSTSELMDSKSYGDITKSKKGVSGISTSNETSSRRRSSALNSHLAFDWWASSSAPSEDGQTGRMTRSRAAGLHSGDASRSGTKRAGPMSKATVVMPPAYTAAPVPSMTATKKLSGAGKVTSARQERGGPGGIASGFFSSLPLPRWGRPSPNSSSADQPSLRASNNVGPKISHHHHHHSSSGASSNAVKYLSARSLPPGGAMSSGYPSGHAGLMYGSASAAMLAGGGGGLVPPGGTFYDRLAPMVRQNCIFFV